MPGIRQSSTKGEFYRALGLNEQNPEDNRKFEAMWVSNGRANLIPMAGDRELISSSERSCSWVVQVSRAR